MSRPTVAVINLKAIVENFRLSQSISNEGQCVAIVKADAYGHGALPVAKALDSIVPAFGVSCIEEADELRKNGIKKPILLLEGLLCPDEIPYALKNNYWIVVESEKQLEEVIDAKLSSPVKVWLKIDSGMHRLGMHVSQFTNAYSRLKESPNVQDEIVLMTHLACADDVESSFNSKQLECFFSLTSELDEPVSIANSAALMAISETRLQWNRPGYMLYGNSPFAGENAFSDQLQNAMTLKSKIISLREVAKGDAVGYSGTWIAGRRSLIATVAIGYGDGYPRTALNGTPLIINGQRAKLAGRVSMDMITVDVTDLSGVSVGDDVILWGDDLSVNEVAKSAGTIGFELLARMPSRTPRRYIES